jgi:transcriptional regulator with XRE-family HTH domain
MPSDLGPYLTRVLRQRGWSYTDLAIKGDIYKSTISRIVNDPDFMPDLITIVRLSNALEVSPVRLMELAGFTILTSRTSQGQQDLLVATLREVPLLAPLLPDLALLPPDQQAAAIAYLEWLIDRHRATDGTHPTDEQAQ